MGMGLDILTMPFCCHAFAFLGLWLPALHTALLFPQQWLQGCMGLAHTGQAGKAGHFARQAVTPPTLLASSLSLCLCLSVSLSLSISNFLPGLLFFFLPSCLHAFLPSHSLYSLPYAFSFLTYPNSVGITMFSGTFLPAWGVPALPFLMQHLPLLLILF